MINAENPNQANKIDTTCRSVAERKYNQTYVSKFIIQNESLITIKMYQIRSNAMTHAIAYLTCDPLQLQNNICYGLQYKDI